MTIQRDNDEHFKLFTFFDTLMQRFQLYFFHGLLQDNILIKIWISISSSFSISINTHVRFFYRGKARVHK